MLLVGALISCRTVFIFGSCIAFSIHLNRGKGKNTLSSQLLEDGGMFSQGQYHLLYFFNLFSHVSFSEPLP